MGTKTVRFSDLTNKIIDDDGEVVRLVVEQHPALTDGPVEIEASKDKVEPIRNGALNVVSLKLYQGDGSPPEMITMEIEAFNKLAGDMDMEDVIRRAGPAYPLRKQAPTSSTSSAADKLANGWAAPSTLQHPAHGPRPRWDRPRWWRSPGNVPRST